MGIWQKSPHKWLLRCKACKRAKWYSTQRKMCCGSLMEVVRSNK